MPRTSPRSFLRMCGPEETVLPTCEAKSCDEQGVYRAPKHIKSSTAYHRFCLKHVQAYNAAWNYYQGMSDAEIEQSQRDALTWNRPTWPFRRGIFGKGRLRREWRSTFNKTKAKPSSKAPPVPLDVQEALKVFGLTLPLTPEVLKRRYRLLAKQYHPDLKLSTSFSNPSQEHIKDVNQAYSVLKAFLKAP